MYYTLAMAEPNPRFSRFGGGGDKGKEESKADGKRSITDAITGLGSDGAGEIPWKWVTARAGRLRFCYPPFRRIAFAHPAAHCSFSPPRGIPQDDRHRGGRGPRRRPGLVHPVAIPRR